MYQNYLKGLLKAIRSIIHLKVQHRATRYLVLILLSRFFSCRSLLDLAQTAGIPKDRLYRVTPNLCWFTYQSAIRRQGFRRLRSRLQKLEKASAATRSRESVTIATDDFTRTARGELGGLTGLFYSGAEKRVTCGINIQAIVAVIGDGKETIVLDARVVFPGQESSGRPPMKRPEWFIQRIESLEKQLRAENLSLAGCRVSVDSAYSSGEVNKALGMMGLPMVSQLVKSHLVTFSWQGINFEVPAWVFMRGWVWLNKERWERMDGESDVEYLRTIVETRTLGRVLVVARKKDDEIKFLLATDVTMKAKTVYRAAKRRWRAERVFWSLKQEVGIGDIHQQDDKKVLARIYLMVILYQALLDTAKFNRTTPGKIQKTLRRNTDQVIQEILLGSAFSWEEIPGEVPGQREAA